MATRTLPVTYLLLTIEQGLARKSRPCTPHPGMLGTVDFGDLTSRYLHNPGSHVNKLRMKRGRSGVKVLILLELDETM